MDDNSIKYNRTVYQYDISNFFENPSDFVKPVMYNARKLFHNITKYLYSTPSMINLVKASIPTSSYQAVFTSNQLNQLAEGSIKLMSDKNGRLLATLVDTKTKKIVSNVELREVSFTPDIAQAMAGVAMQMQMMMISERLDLIQEAVDYIVQGQENDRLATAYGCKERLSQAIAMKDTNNRNIALLNIASDAIDSRNVLMQSQGQIINKIKSFNSSFFNILLSTKSKVKNIDKEIEKLKVNLAATFGVSMVAAVAYEEINELDSARESVQIFSDFLNNTYIKTKLIDRLDLMDPSPDCFWSTNLLPIVKQINKLPSCKSINYLTGGERKCLRKYVRNAVVFFQIHTLKMYVYTVSQKLRVNLPMD